MSRIIRNFLNSILKNLKFILTAVVVSVVIWVAASLQLFPDIKDDISGIPIQVIPTQFMIDENLEVDAANLNTISIQIEGKRRDIDKLTSEDFEAYLDFTNVKAKGTYEVGVIVRALDESKCEIISSEIKRQVVVEKIISKTFDVKVNADAVKVVDGFQLDAANLTCNPTTVTITGKQDLINSITHAEVIASYDGELLASTELKGEIVLYNEKNIKVDNPDIFLDNSYFTVTIPVHKTKTIPLEFTITGCPPNFDIDSLVSKMKITPDELTISSPNNSIDNLSKLNVGVMSLSDLTYKVLNGNIRDTIAPWLAEGYRSISGNASYSLSFTGIENYVSHPFTLTKNNFSIVNAPYDYDVEILTDEITVNVIGPSEHVQALSVDDISILINLSGIEITEGAKTFNVSSSACRINGTKVPSWIVDTPQIDLYFKIR